MADYNSAGLYPWLQPTFDQIKARLQLNRLHHALLFIADDGVGEHELLMHLSREILAGGKNDVDRNKSNFLFDAGTHPDFHAVISEKSSIGVDEIRKAATFVTGTSQLVGNKVVIVEGVERMTESASNALLKTLEEPNRNTYLILSTSQAQGLLATILSRCEKMRVSLPTTEQSLQWLQQQTEKDVHESGLLAYAGSPLKYLAAVTDESPLGFGHFERDLSSLLSGSMSPFDWVEKWQKECSVALRWLLQYARAEYENVLESAGANVIHKVSSLDNCIERIVSANQRAQQAGINKSLLLQDVVGCLLNCSHEN